MMSSQFSNSQLNFPQTNLDHNAQLNQGWQEIKDKGISKLEQYLTSGDKDNIFFSKQEYMTLYTSVYNICTTQIESYPAELYKRYTESIQAYLAAHVLPKLLGLSESALLVELETKWRNHLVMRRWMKSFFQYLDRFFVDMHSITNLTDQATKQFKVVVIERIIQNIVKALL